MNKWIENLLNLHNLYNNLDFWLRKNIRFSRKYKIKNESKINLFDDLCSEKRVIAIEKEQEYFKKYNLKKLKENSTKRVYLENLSIIQLLEEFLLTDIEMNNLEILDIGSKNWFYAFGEYNFFKYANFERDIWLKGIEIDAYRVYNDFHTRYDYALSYIQELENTDYIVGNFLKHKGKYDYITWFFPFVTEFPLLEWGLPLSAFKPDEMLIHAYSSLKKGGKILIVNQDENEYAIQEKLLMNLKIPFIKEGVFESLFLEYEHNRFVTLVNVEF